VGIALVFLAATFAGNELVRYQREHQLEPFRLPSVSMVPTLLPGDCLLVDHRASGPARGELILFRPERGSGVDVGMPWIKRVVAVAGDVVETRGHEVLVNGAPLVHIERPCAPGTPTPPGTRCMSETLSSGQSHGLLWKQARPEVWHVALGPRTLGPDEVFVLGDNRDDSIDSRHIGPIPRGAVMGRVVVVWFSWWEGKSRWSRIGLEL
jgi:signal peptidase I